jgi:hypothetical protein
LQKNSTDPNSQNLALSNSKNSKNKLFLGSKSKILQKYIYLNYRTKSNNLKILKQPCAQNFFPVLKFSGQSGKKMSGM